MKRNISGRSMIEMLGVLAIIGVLSAGGIMGYSTAMENYKVNKFMEMAGTIAAQTNSVFANRPDNAATEEAFYFDSLCSLKILPGEICDAKVPEWGNRYRKGWFGEKLYINIGQDGKNVTGLTQYPVKTKDGDTVRLIRPVTWVWISFQSPLPVTACAKIMSHPAWAELGVFCNGLFIGDNPELPVDSGTAYTICKNKADSFSVFGIDIDTAVSGFQ